MLKRTRIKFCGLVRAQDVDAAVALGVDAVGFVFYAGSSRALTVEEVRPLRRRLPSFVQAVGLFVNAEAAEVANCVRRVGLNVLQFHGDESPQWLAQHADAFGLPWWRAVRMRPETDLLSSAAQFPGAECLLLDADIQGYGGGGCHFDWSWVPVQHPCRLLLAGGLNAESVGAGIHQVRPFAVDVSSGIQGAHPREKDWLRMERFVAAVVAADAQSL